MPIRRRQVIGGALEGLGVGLENLAKMQIQRKNLDAQQAMEEARAKAEADQQRNQGLEALLSKLTADPNNEDQLLAGARMDTRFNGLDLSALRRSDEAKLRPGLAQTATATSEDKILPPELVAKLAGVNAPPTPPAAPDQLAGSQFAVPDQSFATTFPTINPKLQALATAGVDRRGVLGQAMQDELANKGELKRVEAFGAGMGTGAAAHENAPTALADELTGLSAKGPVQARNAGQVTSAQIEAGLDPSVVKREAAKRGAIVGAEEGARNRATEAKPIQAIAFGTPAYKVAQDLAYGKMPATTFRTLMAYSRNADQKLGIYAKAGELNPNFNPAAFEMGFKLATNPKVQQQLASLDNVIQAAPDLLAASDAAKRSGVTFMNQYTNPIKVGIGNKQFSNLKTAQIAFADELSGALGYGSATDMSREMGFNMTDPRLSPENFTSAIQTIVLPFVDRKRATLLNQMGVYGTADFNPAANAPKPTATVPPGSTLNKLLGGRR